MGVVLTMPKTTLPGVVTCTLALPTPVAPIENAVVPPDQLMVGVPVADKVPVTPPPYVVEQVGLEHAFSANIIGAQVSPEATPSISI